VSDRKREERMNESGKEEGRDDRQCEEGDEKNNTDTRYTTLASAILLDGEATGMRRACLPLSG
jgi:hypothetical protein